MFKTISDAVEAYKSASMGIPATCTHVGENNATREELEEAIKQVGALGELAQRFANERFVHEKLAAAGEDTSVLNMSSWTTFENTWRHLVSGSTPAGLPAPPSQRVADTLLAIEDGWAVYREYLKSGSGTPVQVRDIADDVAKLCRDAVTAYVSTAEEMNTDVPGARSAQVSLLYSILQDVLKEASFMSLTQTNRKGPIKALKEQFEEELQSLENLRRLQASSAIDEAEGAHRDALSALRSKWNTLTPVIDRVAEGDFRAESLSNITTYAAEVDKSMGETTVLYSVMTQTTTMTAVHIMMPMPLSGHSAPGATMEVAAKLAADLINEQQKLLPGHRIALDVFDDNCDPDWAMRVMLQRYAKSDLWVAIGGMACTKVCEQIAIISSALWLPALGFDCSEGDQLSDTGLYPDFMRLGARRVGMYNTLLNMKNKFEWNDMVIVASPEATNMEVAEILACEMEGKLWRVDPSDGTKKCKETADRDAVFTSVRSTSIAAGALDDAAQRLKDQVNSAVEVMRQVKTNKERLIYFVGPETQFRYLICASHLADVHPGLTWLSEGDKGRSWWTVEDTALTEQYPECTPQLISQLFQASINIAGLGAPVESHMDEELACFEDHTPRTLNEHVQQTLTDGYLTSLTRAETEELARRGIPEADMDAQMLRNATSIMHPHEHVVNFAVDGVCMLAMAVERMIKREQFTIEDLQKPHQEKRFQRVINFMRNRLEFQGASGYVKMTGNDMEGYLGAWQVTGNSSTFVGLIHPEQVSEADVSARGLPDGIYYDTVVNVSWATGLVNESWAAAPDDVIIEDTEKFPILAVVIPVLVLFFGAICCYAIYSSRKTGGKNGKAEA